MGHKIALESVNTDVSLGRNNPLETHAQSEEKFTTGAQIMLSC